MGVGEGSRRARGGLIPSPTTASGFGGATPLFRPRSAEQGRGRAGGIWAGSGRLGGPVQAGWVQGGLFSLSLFSFGFLFFFNFRKQNSFIKTNLAPKIPF